MAITQLARNGSRRSWRYLLACTALVLVPAGTATASTSAAVPPPVLVKPCVGNKVTGPFVVSGTQVYTNGGKGHKGAVPFRSYGPTVADSLDVKTWTSADSNAVKGDMDEQEIQWAADDWCANTVRIQVNQDLLFTNRLGINESYLHAIEAEVQDALNYKLVVVLNDSTESSANAANELGPTKETAFFWLEMAGIYGHGSGPAHVIFDPFNEPRDFNSKMSESVMWSTWFLGTNPLLPHFYYGMEFLAQWVHGLAPRNLLWIEGPNFSDSFAGMHPNYMITVSNVVYAIHHPLARTVGGKTVDDRTAWFAAFGYLVDDHIAPVVEGEWTNHELPSTAGAGNSACWPDARTQVGTYMQYLAAHGIGLSAFTLNSGSLLRKLPKLNPLEPTQITSSWTCVPGGDASATGTEGAGLAVHTFFMEENTKTST
jgi:hypothetical protein